MIGNPILVPGYMFASSVMESVVWHHRLPENTTLGKTQGTMNFECHTEQQNSFQATNNDATQFMLVLREVLKYKIHSSQL